MIICELAKAYIFMGMLHILIPPEKKESDGKISGRRLLDGSAFAESIFDRFREVYLDELAEIGLPKVQMSAAGLGEYSLNPGSIGGLDSLRRTSKITGREFSKGYKTHVELGMKNLSLNFEVKTPLFEIKADIILAEIKLQMNATFRKDVLLPTFNIRVTELGKISYLFNGKKKLKILTGLIQKVINKALKSKFLTFLGKVFRTAQTGILKGIFKVLPIKLCRNAQNEMNRLTKLKKRKAKTLSE